MNGKGWGWCVGSIALGAAGAVLYMKHKEKLKPMLMSAKEEIERMENAPE